MKKAKIAGYLMGALLAVMPAYAQEASKPADPKPKGQVTVEYGGHDASWYNACGPRTSINYEDEKAGTFSGVYVPMAEDGKCDKRIANDGHIDWTLPGSLTGDRLMLKAIFSSSDIHGYGGGMQIRKSFGKTAFVSGRIMAFDSGTIYGGARVGTSHVDLTFGAKRENGKVDPYGYITLNGGKHDDTFSVGVDANRSVWTNFSLERDKGGTFAVGFYQPSTGNYTLDLYGGFGDLDRSWFTRDNDRFFPNIHMTPRERSITSNWIYPSVLSFAKWPIELRMDNTNGERFINALAGRTFIVKGMKFGGAVGVEHISASSGVKNQPNGEIYFSAPLGKKCFFSISKRVREKEGNLYLSVTCSK